MTAVWGSAPTGTHFKMRGKNAIGRDFRRYLDRDQEHYAREVLTRSAYSESAMQPGAWPTSFPV